MQMQPEIASLSDQTQQAPLKCLLVHTIADKYNADGFRHKPSFPNSSVYGLKQTIPARGDPEPPGSPIAR
jgi:hypothetical protein